jgi:hypothetical protein
VRQLLVPRLLLRNAALAGIKIAEINSRRFGGNVGKINSLRARASDCAGKLPALPSSPRLPRETFEVGIDLGSPISLYHFDRESYAVEGELSAVSVQLKLG